MIAHNSKFALRSVKNLETTQEITKALSKTKIIPEGSIIENSNLLTNFVELMSRLKDFLTMNNKEFIKEIPIVMEPQKFEPEKNIP